MTILHKFRGKDSETIGFTAMATDATLPPEDGPWTPDGVIDLDQWQVPNLRREIAALGVAENGFYLWQQPRRTSSPNSVIESDRVEGTAVFDEAGKQIGTIDRLLIEKTTGKVLYADMTFGGFLGLGAKHHTIAWEDLRYDTDLVGYRTSVTAEQLQGSPAFYADEDWSMREKRDSGSYWGTPPWAH